jgi:chromosome segregation ATPase
MTINSINTQATQFGTNQAIDSYSRNIKEQIAQKQKELQELSKSTEMSLEDKMKKRQEIQQEIADLNSQLRQHQIEQRREQQQSKQDNMTNTMKDTMANANAKEKSEKQTCGTTSTSMQVMSQATMTGIISADNTMKQVKVQSQVKTNLEDRAGVLESEIKYDTSGHTEAKQNELADINSKVNNVISSQASTLSDINNTIKEAEKEDRKTATANEDDKIKSAQNSDFDTSDDDEDENTEIDNQSDVSDKDITEHVNQASNGYPHIDIKL